MDTRFNNESTDISTKKCVLFQHMSSPGWNAANLDCEAGSAVGLLTFVNHCRVVASSHGWVAEL